MKIEAIHKFHDADFSKEWAEKFQPTPPRIKLFETILMQIEKVGCETISILELGIGPGFLADYLLKELTNVTYEGLDYSESMLKIAARRTSKHKSIINFTQADLITEAWPEKLKKSPDIVVSTWALHDLFNKKNIDNVYKSVYKILPEDGVFLNGDFIKPEESNHEYEEGRLRPSEHIKLLQAAGFKSVKCLKEFERDVENPTTANNYACFWARK